MKAKECQLRCVRLQSNHQAKELGGQERGESNWRSWGWEGPGETAGPIETKDVIAGIKEQVAVEGATNRIKRSFSPSFAIHSGPLTSLTGPVWTGSGDERGPPLPRVAGKRGGMEKRVDRSGRQMIFFIYSLT